MLASGSDDAGAAPRQQCLLQTGTRNRGANFGRAAGSAEAPGDAAGAAPRAGWARGRRAGPRSGAAAAPQNLRADREKSQEAQRQIQRLRILLDQTQNSDGKPTLGHLKGLARRWGAAPQAGASKFKNPLKGRAAEEHPWRNNLCPCSSPCRTAGQPCPPRSRCPARHKPLSLDQQRVLNTGCRLGKHGSSEERGDSVIYVVET